MMNYTTKMTPTERKAVASLAGIMGLRLIALFMVLPLFALYARELKGATPLLVGLAIGIYGLAQALFQIPCGLLSDRIGRKPIILFGLILFIIGSLIAASTQTITLVIIGRALQGVGAVGSTILAMIADLTRENQRTKSMALAGISIGLSFSLAMLLGPLLSKWFAVNQLFYLAALFGILAIILLYTIVPTPNETHWHRDTEPELRLFFKLLKEPALLKLNIGVFILHIIFTASFVCIPISLYQAAHLSTNHQWKIYLPTLFAAFLISFIAMGLAERKGQIKPYFLASISMLALAELGLIYLPPDTKYAALSLFLFFTSFSLLEAFQPSLVSRTAPAARKGTALGIYSCSQFFGIFIGGIAGGWLYGRLGAEGVYFFCVILSFLWLTIAFFTQAPRTLILQVLHLKSDVQTKWPGLSIQLKAIPGMAEVAFIPDEKLIYLKMERSTIQHPDFIQLKEQLQSQSLI